MKHFEKERYDVARKYDEEGRAIVNMTVNDDSEFLSPFSEGESSVISEEVAEYIEHVTRSIRPKEEITLQIKSACIDEGEKTVYRNAIKEYYAHKYVSRKRELVRNNVIAAVLAVAGVITLLLAIFLDLHTSEVLWVEVVDIVAWVFVWEAVDVSVLRNHEIRAKNMRYRRYMSMKVRFLPLTKIDR